MFRLSVMSVHAKEASANTERTILFQKKNLSDPQRRDTVNPLGWNDMLQDQADKLEQIARQTEASHGNGQKPPNWSPNGVPAPASYRRRASIAPTATRCCRPNRKIPSQRTKTRKDLIREANNQGVEQITRSRIAPPLDDKLFLKL
ncbi:hypothetical protein [Pseudomonas lactucae]|uniref:hypothetical protein n=1 Tax=Pseudomonas lactucae TaxID=2813360 RepID=UPI0005B41221